MSQMLMLLNSVCPVQPR